VRIKQREDLISLNGWEMTHPPSLA